MKLCSYVRRRKFTLRQSVSYLHFSSGREVFIKAMKVSVTSLEESNDLLCVYQRF